MGMCYYNFFCWLRELGQTTTRGGRSRGLSGSKLWTDGMETTRGCVDEDEVVKRGSLFFKRGKIEGIL